jgi:hypothetical protein
MSQRKCRHYGNSVLDVSITHPRVASVLAAAAQRAGSVAAKRVQGEYQRHQHQGCTFIPASVETYGYLGKHLGRYLNAISEYAATKSSRFPRGHILQVLTVSCVSLWSVAKVMCTALVPHCWPGLRDGSLYREQRLLTRTSLFPFVHFCAQIDSL